MSSSIRRDHEHTPDRELLFLVLEGLEIIMSKAADAVNAAATKIGADLDTISANGLPDPTMQAALDNLTSVAAKADALAASSAPAPVVANLVISPASVSVGVGQTAPAGSVSATDTHGAAIANPVLTFHSSDASIVTVDANGVYTGVAAGTATVTVMSGTVSTTVSVSVA
jgi:uncharacterized protein YjdB